MGGCVRCALCVGGKGAFGGRTSDNYSRRTHGSIP
ncbi:hypothetical protein BACUNI_04119 [Bacteroides uniformis ATCC 8492]|uniref:Mobilization protein n=1 Tax=Bacteroides uniformis (strain ATCC 8492 / DSM 6597 / CCUG 4942 / CIP 103695 / JCM 5828 / KCTC 5204 / NCTC 13054 / VPI 0061) TaxID=411479 RepID=A0ABC9N7C4_BACUC|nr:hypothetical protein BACUNI_04119 [Bacteroides uniformis ATCC 8492]